MESVIKFRADEKTVDKLDELCRELETNKSDAIRRAIHHYNPFQKYEIWRWDELVQKYFPFAEVPFLDYVFEVSRMFKDDLIAVRKRDCESKIVDEFQLKEGKEIEVQHSFYF